MMRYQIRCYPKPHGRGTVMLFESRQDAWNCYGVWSHPSQSFAAGLYQFDGSAVTPLAETPSLLARQAELAAALEEWKR